MSFEEYRAPDRLDREERATAFTWLIAISIVALGLRLGVFLLGPMVDIERAKDTQSQRDLDLASNLLDRGRFALPDSANTGVLAKVTALRIARAETEPYGLEGLRPEVYRMPGYPLFIALFRYLEFPLASQLLIQCLLSTAGVWLVYGIGMRLLGSTRASLLAAAMLAVHPADVVAANSLRPDALFAFLILAALFLLTAGIGRSVQAIAAGGLFIGLSVLVRPTAFFLGPVVAAWLILAHRRAGFVPAMVVLITSLALPAIWIQRNASIGFGHRLSSEPIIAGYFNTAANIDGLVHGQDPTTYTAPNVDQKLDELKHSLTPNQTVFVAMRQYTADRIKSHPMAYAKLLVRQGVRFMLDISATDLFGRFGLTYKPSGLGDRLLHGEWSLFSQRRDADFWVAVTWAGWNILLALLAVIGMSLMLARRQFTAVLLAAGMLAYFLVAAQGDSLERLRQPVIGLEGLLASFLLASLRWPRKRSRPIQGTPALAH